MRYRMSVVVVACVALVALLTVVGLVARRAAVRREEQARVLRGRWHAQNAAALMAMSAVGRLPLREQARFDAAGDDPARMRQVLIEIHEERLATASKDLEDAQQRKVELQGGGGYKVYADQAQPKDLVELANQDEWSATSTIAQDAEALRKIRAWQPETFEAFAAEGGGSGNAGAPPAPVAVAVSKPDPRVPVVSRGESLRPIPGALAETTSAVGAKGSVSRVKEPAAPNGVNAVDAGPRPAGRADFAAAEQVSAEAEIRVALQQWAQAMTLNDPQAETAAYAAHLDRYFLRTDVDRHYVEADKAAYLRRGNRTASFGLQDVQIQNETGATADVRLVKDVTLGQSTSGTTHKLIRSELWMVKTDSGWKIAGERDFR